MAQVLTLKKLMWFILVGLFAIILIPMIWVLWEFVFADAFYTKKRAFKDNPILIEMGSINKDGQRETIDIHKYFEPADKPSVNEVLGKYGFKPLKMLNPDQDWHQFLEERGIINGSEDVFYKYILIRGCQYYYLIIPKYDGEKLLVMIEGTRFTFMCI